MILFLSQTNIETIFLFETIGFKKTTFHQQKFAMFLKLAPGNAFYKAYHSVFLLVIYVDFF